MSEVKDKLITAENLKNAYNDNKMAISELKNQIGNLVSKKQGTENSGKALIIDENGNVICGEAGVSADATLSEEGKAADAKATGDAISELKGDLGELFATYEITAGMEAWPNRYIRDDGTIGQSSYSKAVFISATKGNTYIIKTSGDCRVALSVNKPVLDSQTIKYIDGVNGEAEIKATDDNQYIISIVPNDNTCDFYVKYAIQIASNSYVTPQMFGAIGDGIHDDTDAFQRAINSGRKVVVPTTSAFYAISAPLVVDRESVIIEGESRENVYGDTPKSLIKATKSFYQMLYLKANASYLKLSNLCIDCDNKVNAGVFHSGDEFIHDLYFECASVKNAVDYGFYIGGIYKSTFVNLRTLNGRYGYVIAGNKENVSGTSCVLINCYSDYASEKGFAIDYMAYCSLISCAVDHTEIAYAFSGCKGMSVSGCGCEHISTPIYMSEAVQNVSMNIDCLTAMFFNVESEKDAIIYCGQVQNLRVGGIITESDVKRTYDIYSSKDIATIYVLDGSVNSDKCYTKNNSITFIGQ